MLGSGSAGNSALIATDHCKILIDGGLSARQVVLRLEQCGVTPEQLDGVVLTHEHSDHIRAIDSIVSIENELVGYHIDAITPGEDAQGAVTVRIQVDGTVYSGHGVATDIVESSVRAYLTALNRSVVAVRPPLKVETAV
jgi:metal-dependent hydrolase (beta-lactamase superfamily II)